MKTILIFFLLGLTLSYDREAVAKCIDDYNKRQKENSNEKTPNLDRDKDSAKIIGHCMYSAGKADFNGCNQNRDEHGNFLSSSALRDCLISKGWKKSKPLKISLKFKKVKRLLSVSDSPSIEKVSKISLPSLKRDQM